MPVIYSVSICRCIVFEPALSSLLSFCKIDFFAISANDYTSQQVKPLRHLAPVVSVMFLNFLGCKKYVHAHCWRTFNPYPFRWILFGNLLALSFVLVVEEISCISCICQNTVDS